MEVLHDLIGLIHEFSNYVYGHLVGYGYFGITFMMTLESSFILFPSEICIIPAGIEVSRGNLTMFGVIFWGTVGSWIGSTINYVIARFYGREFLEKFGKYVRLDLQKIQKLDKYFQSHGKMTVFVIRFIPVVRQYISFPAGMAKMNFAQFSLYTCLGAGMWVTVLAYLGASLGDEFGAIFANQQIDFDLMSEMLKPRITELTIYAFAILAFFTGIYLYFSKKYLQEIK